MRLHYIFCVLPAVLALPHSPSAPSTPPSAAAAIQPRAEDVDFDYRQLWNVTGPTRKDPRQSKVFDCWWKAGQAAIAHVNPDWIKDLFYTDPTGTTRVSDTTSPGTRPNDTDPTVRLYDPDTHQPHHFTVNIAQRSTTEDKAFKGFFWPDAQTQALRQLNQTAGVNLGLWEERRGYMQHALSILTGLPARNQTIGSYGTQDSLFAFFQYCNSTPIMFQTGDQILNVTTKTQFGKNHIYPVISAWWGDDGQRMVGVRNVWGADETYKLEDIWTNAIATIYLTGWDFIMGRRPA